MTYAPNVLSKGDICWINGVRFRCKYDFNIAKGDKNLLLIREDEPKVHMAYTEDTAKHKGETCGF